MAQTQEQREKIARLEARIEELQANIGTAPAPDESLGTRERESLLKLVIGMAVGGYGFDPKEGRSGRRQHHVAARQCLGGCRSSRNNSD